jgi:Fic family protein
VLWKLNQIHPFINGNGRTARAACYFLLCVKSGGWIAGDPILPTLIRQNRDEYVAALQQADANWLSGNLDFSVLHALVARLLTQQMASVSVTPSTP